jgi:hypothetical protein
MPDGLPTLEEVQAFEEDRIPTLEEVAAFEVPETTVRGVFEETGKGIGRGGLSFVEGIKSAKNISEANRFLKAFEDFNKFTFSPIGTLFKTRDFLLDKFEGEINKATLALAPKEDASKTERIFGQAGEVIGQVGAGALTGQPLIFLSANAGVQKWDQALKEGQSFEKAMLAGASTALVEYVTEIVPLGKLGTILKGKSKQAVTKFLRDMLAGVGADILGEITANAVERGLIDPAFLDKEAPSLVELWEESKEVAMVSLLAMLGLSGGAKAVGSVINADRKTPIEISPELKKELDLPPDAPTEMTLEAVTEELAPAHVLTDQLTDDVIQEKSDTLKLQEVQETLPFEELEPTKQALREDAIQEFPDLENDVLPIPHEDLRPKVPLTDEEIAQTSEIEDTIIPSEQSFFDDKVTKVREKAEKELAAKEELNIKRMKRFFNKAFFNQSPVREEILKSGTPEAQLAVDRHVLQTGSTQKAANVMSFIWNKTFKGLPAKEAKMLNAIIQNRRNVEIKENNPDFQFEAGLTVKDFAGNTRKIPGDKLLKLYPKAKAMWGHFRGLLEALNQEGLITDSQLKGLGSKGEFYSPRKLIETIDGPDILLTHKGKTTSIPDSGLPKLSKEGSLKRIVTDVQRLNEEATVRTYHRIFKHRAWKALYDFAVTNTNDIVRPAKVVKTIPAEYEVVSKVTGNKLTDQTFETKTQAQTFIKGQEEKFEINQTKEEKLVFEDTPRGMTRLTTVKDGKPVAMFMPEEQAAEWTLSTPGMDGIIAKSLQIISGTIVLKPMATGLNLGFAVAQIPLDFLTQFTSAESQYSSFAPLASLQLGAELKKTWEQALFREGELYDTAIDEGIGFGSLTTQSRITKNVPGSLRAITKLATPLRWLENTIGGIVEASEMMTRLALVDRGLKNKMSKTRAAANAKMYLNFFDGGWLTKAINNFAAYFNVPFQVARTAGRAFKKQPVITSWKLLQLGGLSMMLKWLWTYTVGDEENNEKPYDEMNQFDKDNFFTFPLLSTRDERGFKRWAYFKIKKPGHVVMISKIFEALSDKAEGRTVDFPGIQKAFKSFLPLFPDDATAPIFDAYLGYVSNWDFWRGQPISRQFGKVDPKAEFDETTPKVFVRIGEAAGLSPERFRYALNQYFTSGNEWTSLTAVGASRIFGQAEEASEPIQDELFKRIKKWSKWPIIKKFIGVTNPRFRIEKEQRDLKIEEGTRKREQKMELDNKIREFLFDGKKGDSVAAVKSFRMIDDYIATQPFEDQNRLKKREGTLLKKEGVVDPGFWERLSFNQPNVKNRARSFVSMFNQMPVEAKTFYVNDLGRVRLLNLWGYNGKAKGEIKGKKVNWTFDQWVNYYRSNAEEVLNKQRLPTLEEVQKFVGD